MKTSDKNRAKPPEDGWKSLITISIDKAVADIFISYAREDHGRAKVLAEALARHSWSVWWDPRIPTGQRFDDVITAQLAITRCVIVLWSSHSVLSPWVREEAADARERNILAPVLVEAVRPPLGFRSLQAADLTTWQGDEQHPGFQHLLADIRSSLGGQTGERRAQYESGEKRAQAEPGERAMHRAKPIGGPQAPPGPTFHRKHWVAILGVVVLVAAAGVTVYEAGKESPPTPSPPPDTQGTSSTSVALPSTEPAVKPDQPEVTVIRQAATRTKDQHEQTFRDCYGCPEMVMVPAGTFTMGSPKDEKGRQSDEGPQHRVTIAPFAMGKTEVTFAEWDACVAAGGCNGYKPHDQGWGRGSRPVVNVSWKDAKVYVNWLSQYTGKPYRLPSEAEWEYSCRAGTTTPFSFGETIMTDQANYHGNYAYGTEASGVYRQRTTEVGSFAANPWGLYDMHGNISEWVEDVWHKSYEGAPDDGAAWTGGEEGGRVNRGGSWESYPWALRSASRSRVEPDHSDYFLGFRVARTFDFD